MKYLRIKKKKGVTYHFWQPKSHYVVQGTLQRVPEVVAARALGRDAGEAHQAAIELYDLLKVWRRGEEVKARILEGTVDWLISQYKADAKFIDLNISTQKLYLGHFKDIGRDLGDVPIGSVSRKSARAFCVSFSDSKRKPSAIASTCRVLFKHAMDMGIISTNPFTELGISKPKPRKAVWSHEDEARLLPAAIEHDMMDVYHAAIIGIYSAQRPQDIRSLAMNHYDGRWWRVTQKKTEAVLDIPVYKIKQLKEVLDKLARTATSPVLLIYKGTGKPFSKELLCHKFRELCDAAGIGENLQFRDFRRTTVVRLGESGCTNAEIAAITGHTIENVAKILKVYLPTNRLMAVNAANKMNRKKSKKLELAIV